MFPVTITLNNADQLNAVLAAMNLGTNVIVGQVAEKAAEKPATKKTPPVVAAAATEVAATPATAAGTAAQEPKAEASAAKLLDADELANAVRAAIAKSGRDPVVALLTSYGVKKAGEVEAAKRAEFDVQLIALAA